jgi:hypothetical protein
MRTLKAQRLKKQVEKEYRHRQGTMEDILAEARAEVKKLEGLLDDFEEITLWEAGSQVFEEYREDDEAVYFEEGFLER